MAMLDYEAQTSVVRYNVLRLVEELIGTESDMTCWEDQREEATLYIQTRGHKYFQSWKRHQLLHETNLIRVHSASNRSRSYSHSCNLS